MEAYPGAVVDPTRDADRERPDRERPAPQARRAVAATVITDAQGAASAEMSGRMRRYAITMAFRTACFLGMIFAQGWVRWVLLAAAVLLPYVAVVLANQADHRTKAGTVEYGAPVDALQIGTGQFDAGSAASSDAGGEVIEGTVDDDPAFVREPGGEPEGRVA